ncbi:MAG: FecR family protein [Gemmatimonadales bacterium]
MDDLILRSLDGATTEDEERALAEWRAASPDHERRFRGLAQLVGALGAVSGPRRRVERPSAAALIERANRPRALGGARPSRRVWIAAVAAALVVLGIGTRRAWRTPVPLPPMAPAAQVGRPTGVTEVTTGVDERSTTRLVDGSLVRLAPNSRLSLGAFATDHREVWVDGTAYFAVTKQAGAPFVVRTSAGSATVLGTQFELRASERQLRVVVVEGKVEVGDGERSVRVSAGEMTVLDEGLPAAVQRVANAREIVAWVGRLLVFQDTPLRQVAAEIEQRYGVHVEIEDGELARKVVTASFSDQPAERVLSVVCQVVDAECAVGADSASIRRKR